MTSEIRRARCACWRARLGRADETLLAPVKHRGSEAQADVAVAKARDALGAEPHPARQLKSSRQVGAYLGLRPRKDQSGATDKQLRITKAGDTYLRRLLVNCANYILGPFGADSELRSWD
ncbi:IS110 family transposase [Archangium violaceum]|nr:IS110 family transposase [Archangium violaceum]